MSVIGVSQKLFKTNFRAVVDFIFPPFEYVFSHIDLFQFLNVCLQSQTPQNNLEYVTGMMTFSVTARWRNI